MKLQRLLGAALAICLTCSVAQAAPITFFFQGEVTNLTQSVDRQFAIGQAITGAITYEPTTADVVPSSGSGFFPGAVSAFVVDIGTYRAENANLGAIGTANDNALGQDAVNFVAEFKGADVNGQSPNFIRLTLFDAGGTALTSDGLPGSFAALLPFPTIGLDISFDPINTRFASAAGVISALSAEPFTQATSHVPEPSTLAVMLAGLVGFGLVMGRRRGT